MSVAPLPPPGNHRFISVIERLTLLVALTVALILPLGYATLTYMHLAEQVETQARVTAYPLTELISGNPKLWGFKVLRIEHLLARDAVMLDGEAVSAYDANGVLLASVGNRPDPPLLRRSHPLYDSGRIVGRVEVEHSLRGLIVEAALAALLGALLGGAVYVAFHKRPLRTLRRMGTALEAEQAALRESERNYRTLIEWSPESITVHKGGKLIYVNPAAIKLFGATSAQDLIGKTVLDLVHPDFHQISRARLKNLEENGVNAPLIMQRFLKLDGTGVDVEVQGIRIFFNGEPAVHVSMRDITERKQAEATLHQSDQRFRDLVDSTDGIVWEADAATFVFNFVSKNAVRLLGYPMVDWLQPGFWPSHIHPQDRDQAVQYCVACTGRFEDHEFEYRFIAEDGRVVWLRDIVKVVEENGKPRWLRGLMLDITERKQAQVAISKAAQRLEIALEGSLISVFESDLRSGEIWLDAAWGRHLGLPPGETRTTAAQLLTLVHPDDRQSVVTAAVQIMKEPTSGYLLDHRVKTLGGGWRWIQCRGQVTERDSAGHPLRMSGTNTDITERKQAEAARMLLEARLRESQKMEAIGTLAGGIAHDFNNIIATILGNAELARQDMNANPQALESLEEIRKAGSRARDLVQQILSFSRRQPTEKKPTALVPIIEESTRLLRATLPARITLEVHCDAAVPTVRADANQIQQILINLVTNAMQAMPGGPGHIGIRLDTVMLDAAMAQAHPALRALHEKHPGRTLRLAVSDNGPGMDAATLARIFEPFFTTKPVDEGTGLGLAVVHGIVETHEGEIEVASQPGRGTTFTIYLPVAAAEANATVPDERAAATALPSRATGGHHILYLDDDESLVYLVTRLLERQGFRISGFIDQHKALDALRCDPADFDLVVTDYNMPGMSGLDVARQVRAIRADLPVAVASGFIDETLRAQADGAGVRELIFKANAVEELCEAFARLAQTVGEKAGSSRDDNLPAGVRR